MIKIKFKKDIKNLVEACENDDIDAVHKMLQKGHSVQELNDDGKCVLSIVCRAGYYNIALILLEMEANLEIKCFQNGWTPIMEAAMAGHVTIISLLHSYGANVNAVSINGNSALMYASSRNHIEAVKELIKCGANLNIRNKNGFTALMIASSAGYITIAKILLEHGAMTNTYSSEYNESALTLACHKGYIEMVQLILSSCLISADEMFDALTNTAIKGHVDIAGLLIDSGAQINKPLGSTFESPLTLAANNGHINLALFLIGRGIHIDVINYEGYTPLMKAALNGHDQMVSVLIDKGANVNELSKCTKETALTLTCSEGYLTVADILIRHGTNLDIGASTPLMRAAQIGHMHLVSHLLHSGANVNIVTAASDTALTYACENGHTNVADLLIQFGANVDHECEYGYTGLMKACRDGHLPTVQFLVSENANVNKISVSDGHTPLSLACAEGHVTVVKYLLANRADPFHKLHDQSTMVLLAARRRQIDVVKLLVGHLCSFTDIKGIQPFVRTENAEVLQYLDDEELKAKTIETCEELATMKQQSTGSQSIQYHNYELLINSLVDEHLSKVRRFHRICNNLENQKKKSKN